MPGKTFEDILKMRQMIADAIDSGMESPAEIINWIERKNEDAPALATVIRVMRQKGYSYVDGIWVKKGK
jgi:hypothetical protein